MKLGRPQKGLCPLSLACYEAIGLPEHMIEVTPKVLTIHDWSGRIVYVMKWPEIAANFYQRYFERFKLGYSEIKAKPCSFEIGVVEFFSGYRVDILDKVVKRLNDPEGDYYAD